MGLRFIIKQYTIDKYRVSRIYRTVDARRLPPAESSNRHQAVPAAFRMQRVSGIKEEYSSFCNKSFVKKLLNRC